MSWCRGQKNKKTYVLACVQIGVLDTHLWRFTPSVGFSPHYPEPLAHGKLLGGVNRPALGEECQLLFFTFSCALAPSVSPPPDYRLSEVRLNLGISKNISPVSLLGKEGFVLDRHLWEFARLQVGFSPHTVCIVHSRDK